MTVYAKYETKNSSLASDFGYDWACKLFGAECINTLPRYVRGPKVGKPKGFVIWINCTAGGWSRELGGVLKPGLARAWLGTSQFSTNEEAIRGQWLGREQAVGGPRCYLFEDGRRAEMDRQDRLRKQEAAEWLERAAEHEACAVAMLQNPNVAHLAQKSLDAAAAIRQRFSEAV